MRTCYLFCNCILYLATKNMKNASGEQIIFLTSAWIMIARIIIQYISPQLKLVAFSQGFLQRFLCHAACEEASSTTFDKGVINRICQITIRISWVALG